MRRLNLLAAGVLAATFTTLASLPATRDSLRSNACSLTGTRPFGKTLAALGMKPDDLPGAFGPSLPAVAPEPTAPPSPEFAVRLASATRLPGPEKWIALQRLADDFPAEPAAHAAITRFACKNGGSVGVGREIETQAIVRETLHATISASKPEDIAILLRATEAGERLDPDNAYFPAMAAVGFFAASRDDDARAALHRAGEKPRWREYFDVEAQGVLRRAELLHGPQISVTRTAYLAALLFPHYAQLRAMSRLATAQAVDAEQAGDSDAGLALRRDLWHLGARMRRDASPLIGSLVGIAIARIAILRPDGAPLADESADETTRRASADRVFADYLQRHGAPGESNAWMAESAAQANVRTLIDSAADDSVFGLPALFETQARLITGLALSGAITALCLLAALAFVHPGIGRAYGRRAARVVLGIFVAAIVWTLWGFWGNLRDLIALGALTQGMTASSAGGHAALVRTACGQGGILLAIALTGRLFPTMVGIQARRRRIPRAALFQRWTLPLAALLTVGYAVHVAAFAGRERRLCAELTRMTAHEGRYLSKKTGKAWPE